MSRLRPWRLRHPFDEVIGRHVRAGPRRFGTFFRPREMTIVAVELFRHRPDVHQEANQQVRRGGFVSVLRVLDAQGSAIRTADGVMQRAFFAVPIEEELIGLLELISRNFNARSFHARTIVNGGGDSGCAQSSLQRLGIRAVMEKCDRGSVHGPNIVPGHTKINGVAAEETTAEFAAQPVPAQEWCPVCEWGRRARQCPNPGSDSPPAWRSWKFRKASRVLEPFQFGP